jgi:acyl-CoA dehydrogenase
MLRTIDFFEKRGKQHIKQDDRERVWYSDFLEFIKREKIFATLLTPPAYGDADARWDTWRICEFNEILSFYGLCYWYTWQVSILGLGPIWMSQNEELKRRAAQLLQDGAVFAFGLSEQAHGADLYSSETTLFPQDDGTYKARGTKYYIGNGNVAPMVATFGKLADSGEYVFFVVNSQHEKYECVKNITSSQNYVAEFLYDMYVTDFSHVKRMFVDAYSRLIGMKLFALRAADYMRSASPQDRRYLLYNPVVKMKVTTQGERVIDLLWDVIAAKGFEKDTYFEMAARDIRSLPKLEGTVHVNIALILKFIANYFFNPAKYPQVPTREDAKHDDFLFNQGRTRGLGKIRFHDYNIAFNYYDLPNVNVFKEQISVFKAFLLNTPPDEAQRRDVDFLMALGEIFTLVVYGQLILENSEIYAIHDDLVDQIFDFMVRDFSEFALQLYGKPNSTPRQMAYCTQMIKKPATDVERYERVWRDHVYALKDTYEMNA